MSRMFYAIKIPIFSFFFMVSYTTPWSHPPPCSHKVKKSYLRKSLLENSRYFYIKIIHIKHNGIAFQILAPLWHLNSLANMQAAESSYSSLPVRPKQGNQCSLNCTILVSTTKNYCISYQTSTNNPLKEYQSNYRIASVCFGHFSRFQQFQPVYWFQTGIR